MMRAGGLQDQPCTYMSTINLIDNMTNHYSAERQKADAEKRKK